MTSDAKSKTLMGDAQSNPFLQKNDLHSRFVEVRTEPDIE